MLRYLGPMRDQLTTPTLIVGLAAPEAFRLIKRKGAIPSEVIYF
jgi:hypothetical protein